MNLNCFPHKQGLYDPTYEHDACGIGVVANIKGIQSHKIIDEALNILVKLNHRGGSGAEENTGDGAGILIQIPHAFFSKACSMEGFSLPQAGCYGVGMLFLPQELHIRQLCEEILCKIIAEEGQMLLGFRDVPFHEDGLGHSAKGCMPYIRQVFIGRSKDITDDVAFERKLYVIRKRMEKESENYSFYAASFSSKTIVYKGMLTAEQVRTFYKDLSDPHVVSALALVHSRYSTNTFPSWERAHPNRYIIHNGEINTLRGNVNWMHARQSLLESEIFGDDMEKILPVIQKEGSDSAIFDNCFEFLTLSGRSLAHSAMMMIPEPWSKDKSMSDEKRAFYEYHAMLMEPWDGPAAIAFTDGTRIGAVLDRNGLRPARYYVTKDDLVVLSSEVGVLPLDPENVVCKERLHPGKMLLIDMEKGQMLTDQELKDEAASAHPYRKWLASNLVKLKDLPEAKKRELIIDQPLIKRQKLFGYSFEDIKSVLLPMAKEGVDPIGAMGNDTPLAVLSEKPQLLYNYFKQLFAQVTNPPIDALREEIVTATEVYLGTKGKLLCPTPECCKQIKCDTPILSNVELAKILELQSDGFRSATLPILFSVKEGGPGLEKAMQALFERADKEIENGSNILVLSDRGANEKLAPIPALLAVSGLHHHLIRRRTRTRMSIILESGEPREVHHFALLIGYGASCINPYLAFESIEGLIDSEMITGVKLDYAIKKYTKAAAKGIVKVLSKMGISTMQSYHGAQIFEAVGIGSDVIEKYFSRTPSRIEGIGMEEIAKEAGMRHNQAFFDRFGDEDTLDTGGDYQWRADGEYHMFNPETIHKLQIACRNNDYSLFKEYSASIGQQSQKLCTLRGLMDFDHAQPIAIEEVESVQSICKRFKTGAMSYGSISREAHESLAIAMNRIGGKSNTGEGGEDPLRFLPMENGDSKCSAIKQVASGRFGVTSHYLVNAKEIQIKMAQGAKPGEGGQLPGRKVYPWIAHTRHSTPGVGLISPPPHHDIYSIEDLAELIHDLKNANRHASISVKLVSEVGVGTIAAGVAKGRADGIVISGYDGGTGASPRTSIRHAGLPWELGLSEAHQTLVMNHLRSRVKLETDGKLLTGRDIAIAALLGAEEFAFATTPLIVLGCVMMRVCNLDTCPVGVATQNPELRKKFSGDPSHVVNFMHFLAQELREYMAQIGFRTVDEMVGRSDKLKMNADISHWKAKGLDYSTIFFQPEEAKNSPLYCQTSQDHGLDESLDMKVLLQACAPAIENGQSVSVTLPIYNTNRVVGTILGSEVTRKHGPEGLPEDTIRLFFHGSAGQSLGAFVPKGMTISLEGDANDYIGKGLSGGKMMVFPPKNATYAAEDNIIVGNVAFYGATGGQAYICGAAGERFCVRNSGLHAVVEAVGDHGCEYMTGGKVVVLGKTGRNFAAGMSGGVAYVLDTAGDFEQKCNQEMVDIGPVESPQEIQELRSLIEKHVEYTGSSNGKRVLKDFEKLITKFIQVMPRDYKRMMDAIENAKSMGLSGDDALMDAFDRNFNDGARKSGN